MASTQSYENVAFSAPGNIRNAESDSNQSNIHKDEPNTYESLQHFNPEPPLKKQKTTTNRAACNREYLCLGILIGVLCCFLVVAIGFAAAAWTNSMDAQAQLVATQNRLKNVQSIIDDLTARLGNVENENNATTIRLNIKENETDTMITALEMQLFETQNVLKNVQSINDAQTTQLGNVEHENSATTIRLNIKENETDTRITELETKSQLAGESAFMAVMTVGDFRPTQIQVIPFNTAPVNPGSHYNTTSSVYTCPQHGLYIFSFSLYSRAIGGPFDEDRVSGALMLDGVMVAEVVSQNRDPVYWQQHQVATTAVVDCPAGGTVWVESRYAANQISGFVSAPKTIFTGYAIMLY